MNESLIHLLRDVYTRSGTLHHACLLCGEQEQVIANVRMFLEKDLSITINGNPDVHFLEFDTFKVKDGRVLQEIASKKAFGERKIFVTAFNSMTVEAQNALLKLFEEPTKNTHFFLITKTEERLLPTLRSRLFILGDVSVEDAVNVPFLEEAKVFIQSNPAKRLEHIKDIVTKKDKAAASRLLNALELHLKDELRDKEGNTNQCVADALTDIIDARHYLFDRSSSVKLLLEHVAATLPKV